MPVKREVCYQPGPKRPNYFYGQLLNAEDLQREQEYHQAKRLQLSRAVFGYGIIQGLSISCAGQQVTVSAGMAVDKVGQLIELTEPCHFNLPPGAGTWNVVIELLEEKCDPRPSPLHSDDEGQGTQFGNVQEVIKLWLEAAVGKMCEALTTGGVCLGQIRARKGRGQQLICAIQEIKPARTIKPTRRNSGRRQQAKKLRKK
jgi:hypothetical protein